MIESIDRLSMEANEMGWERSSKEVKSSILSAFCVHPFILGEPLNVGGYSQATEIKERFFERRVQLFLGLLNEKPFREIADKLEGYDLSLCGKVLFPVKEG